MEHFFRAYICVLSAISAAAAEGSAADARFFSWWRTVLGTSNALPAAMPQSDESWTIPLQVIVVTTLVVGLIMVMAVVLMN